MAKGADSFSPNTVIPTQGDRKLARELFTKTLQAAGVHVDSLQSFKLTIDEITTSIARHAMVGLAKPNTPKENADEFDAGRKLYKALEASAEEGYFTDMTGPEDANLDGHFDLVKAARLFGESK